MTRSSRLFLLLLSTAAILGAAATAFAAPRYVPGEVIVKYRATAKLADHAGLQRDMRAQPLHSFAFIHAEHLRLEAGVTVEQAIARFKNDPRVEYVEPNYIWTADVVPNDPRFPELYGMRNTGQTGGTPGDDIHAVNAWDVFTGDPNLMVGVIDTGVDYNHPDLVDNIWTNPGEIPGNGIDDDGNGYVDDVHGYDFASNDGDPFDDNGHGTHVSGTIAGEGNNGIGVAGVNWHCKIVAIKFLNAGGSGTTEGAIAGVQYAIAVGVRLTSNSWGGGGFSQALLDAINAAGAAGQLFVAAAGNAGSNTDVTPFYPSGYDTPYIISVAATDNNDNLASFSNYGATTVDLSAPGVDILSSQPGGGYQLLSGTSMATPHVSGACALLWGRLPALTNLQVKQQLLLTVDHRASLVGKCVSEGRLNVFLAVAEPDTLPPGGISDLATHDPGSNTMGLSWTAPGDDGNTGHPSSYTVAYSTSPIVSDADFDAATHVTGPTPHDAGTAESFEVSGLASSTSYYFAVKAYDEFNNAGPLSNVATGTTLGAPDIDASPTSFSASLLTGATADQTLTLSNTAAGTLDFTIPTPQLLSTQVVFPYVPYDKHAPDTRVGPPVTTGAGGPDAFGYRWIDSDEPGGPAFSWVDITGVGTSLALTGDDALSPAIPIGFTFPFYGGSSATVRVCTNGFMTLTGTTSPYDNQMLPNAGAPGNLLAPMWDDMDFGATPRVYYYNDGARFIVSWVGVPHYTSGGPYTFQAILYPSGEVRYQYLTLGSPTNSATVGVQNATGTQGLNVAFNTSYLHDNLAVRIFAIPQWLTASPSSGRILAGQSQQITVHFDASGLLGGIYNANLNVLSNDPDENPLPLTAQLHVEGAPDIAVNPASLAFGTVFVGASPTQNLVVSNPGTDVLNITSIASGDPYVTVNPGSFSLNPSGAQNVTVTYHPLAVSTTSTNLSISSNDPDQPTVQILVTGAAVPAPSFSTEPDSFAVALATNTATSRNLRIRNNGGSNYSFTADAVATGGGASVVKGDADNVPLEKGQPDVQSGPMPASAGGPDAFGYTFIDSDSPGGPVFSWVDISVSGAPIALTGDDANAAAVPIGFTFPFYGTTFSSVRVCTNGWLSFTSSLTSYSNTALPNNGSGVPENLLAVYWDDFNFGAVQRARWLNDGTRFIVQYTAVPRYQEATPNTFQVILYPNGNIVYQYLSIGATTQNSETIGIQNAARNDGLQVVFNAPYMHSNLAIRFRPPARFLTVTPGSGSIPPGGFQDLTVGFNASGLFGGTYRGAVHLVGNDPILPQKDVPCRLDVTGVPDLAANPGSIAFGNVYVGAPQLRQLQIQNTGTDVLSVSDIQSSNPAFSVDQTSFNIAPLGSAIVYVSFNPGAAAPYSGQLTIASNDPDTPNTLVGVSGTGVNPPEIDVTPGSLRVALATTLGPAALTRTRQLVIENQGGSNLNWSLDASIAGAAHFGRSRAGVAAMARHETPAAELPKGDPGTAGVPQLAASGGPDAFGYRWVDSDSPEGPAFSWIDISGVGTPIALNGDDQNLGPFPLPFGFTFYGNAFNAFNICSNGFVSFSSTATTFTNSGLPNTGAPFNLLAAFWDDQDFRTSGQAFYHYDGSKFIIEFLNAPHYSSGGPYTYEIILFPNGTIDYQYLDMQSTRLNEATIGIQNADGSDGLQVVFNADYVHNNLRVRFSTAPPWLTIGRTSGVTPPGTRDSIDVNFNATGLGDGDYAGNLHVTSNDLNEPGTDVPVALHVGVATAGLDVLPMTLSSLVGPNWIDAHITPPGTYDPHLVRGASLLIEGALGTAPGSTPSYGPSEAVFNFDRLALLPMLGEGRNVPLSLIGEVDGETWFSATDIIRVLKPVPYLGLSGPYLTNQNVPIHWDDPAEGTPTYYKLWFSSTGGKTWSQVQPDPTGHSVVWQTPAEPTDGGMLELMAFDESGYMGSAFIGPFRIQSGTTAVGDGRIPTDLSLRFAGANPVRGAAHLELALPLAARVQVRVHDVRGALVRELSDGEMAAGVHPLVWDGTDGSGRSAGSGVYFIQVTAGRRTLNTRLALIH